MKNLLCCTYFSHFRPGRKLGHGEIVHWQTTRRKAWAPLRCRAAVPYCWFASRLSMKPVSCWLPGFTSLLSSQLPGGLVGRKICLLSRFPWHHTDGDFFLASSGFLAQVGLLTLWLLLCVSPEGWAVLALQVWTRISDTMGLTQWEACPRPPPSPALSVPKSLGEAFQHQPPPSLNSWHLFSMKPNRSHRGNVVLDQPATFTWSSGTKCRETSKPSRTVFLCIAQRS